MQAERATLTPQQIALAESRVDFTHPLITALDNNLPQINIVLAGSAAITDASDYQRYDKQNYGFLADAFASAGPFTLEPLEIVSIWSRVGKIAPNSRLPRYELARMMINAYAIQGTSHKGWQSFPRHFLETNELPAEVLEDKVGIKHVTSRMLQVHQSLMDLDAYAYGDRDSGPEATAKLALRIQEGDKNAQEEYEKLLEYYKAHRNELLEIIHENFGNAFVLLSPLIKRYLVPDET